MQIFFNSPLDEWIYDPIFKASTDISVNYCVLKNNLGSGLKTPLKKKY